MTGPSAEIIWGQDNIASRGSMFLVTPLQEQGLEALVLALDYKQYEVNPLHVMENGPMLEASKQILDNRERLCVFILFGFCFTVSCNPGWPQTSCETEDTFE